MSVAAPDTDHAGHGRSLLALAAGFVVVVALSLGIDEALHRLAVYPPWDQPMWETGDNLLALSYRLIIGVIGGWVTARLAPRAPLGHALVLGALGTVLGLVGVLVAARFALGPIWYPIALAATALPCAWLGGKLAR